MKSQPVISILLCILCWTCEIPTDNNYNPAEVFEIHLQSRYNKTPVVIRLDGSVILDDTVTTNSILHVAAIIKPNVYRGFHRLQAVINETVEADTTIIVDDTLYVGVNFDPKKNKIRIWAQLWRFPYR